MIEIPFSLALTHQAIKGKSHYSYKTGWFFFPQILNLTILSMLDYLLLEW